MALRAIKIRSVSVYRSFGGKITGTCSGADLGNAGTCLGPRTNGSAEAPTAVKMTTRRKQRNIAVINKLDRMSISLQVVDLTRFAKEE